jgi:hypothetical protein
LTVNTPTLDVDILDHAVCQAVFERITERFEKHGQVLCRTGNAPKFAVPFRTDTPFKKIRVELLPPDINLLPDGKVRDDVRVPAFEFLGDGQQFICFGIHPDTKADYRWDPPGFDPALVMRKALPAIDEAAARALVDDLVSAVIRAFGFRRLKEEQEAHARRRVTTGKPREAHNGWAGAYTRAALDRECETVARAASGARNDALNKAAFNLGQLVGGGELSEEEVSRRLHDAAVTNGMIKDDGPKAARDTLWSGLRDGMKQPRTAPQADDRFSARATDGPGARKAKDKGAPPEHGADAGDGGSEPPNESGVEAGSDPAESLRAVKDQVFALWRD